MCACKVLREEREGERERERAREREKARQSESERIRERKREWKEGEYQSVHTNRPTRMSGM